MICLSDREREKGNLLSLTLSTVVVFSIEVIEMWYSQVIVYLILFNCCLYYTVQTQGKISNKFLNSDFFFSVVEFFLIVDEINSTNEQWPNSRNSSLPIWTNEELVVCLVSVSLGTLLFCVTFIVPAMIIIRRSRREKKIRFDLRELRRMSDFI